MASAIDATKPVDGVPAVKADLRANLAAAKAEIEALQAAPGGAAVPVQDEGSTIVAAPTALDFRGTGVGVTNVSGVARVTIPGAVGGTSIWVDVTAAPYGATGNGTTDDTPAFVAALNAINNSGLPGTLWVPAPPGGSYRFGYHELQPKVPIRIVGERSRIKRLDNVKVRPSLYATDYFTDILFIAGVIGTSPVDSLGYYPLVTFENIIFDGNRANQAQDSSGTPWAGDGSNETMHGVNVASNDTTLPWRQPVHFVDCDFEFTGGDGISIFKNASIRATRCRFYACWRGGVTIVSCWNEFVGRDLISDDPLNVDPNLDSGFYMEMLPAEGYKLSNRVDIDGWVFNQGSIGVATLGDNRVLGDPPVTAAPRAPDERDEIHLRRLVVAQGNKAEQIKFYSSGEATLRISDSIFYGTWQTSATDLARRRPCLDGCNIEVDRCIFVASNGGFAAGAGTPGQFVGLWIRDHLEYTSGHYGHRITNCDFMVDVTCLDGDFNGASVALAAPVYAISCGTNGLYMGRNAEFLGGMVPPKTVVENCRFRMLKYYKDRVDTAANAKVFYFDYMLYGHYGSSWQIVNCEGVARNGFRLNSNAAGLPGHYEFVGGRYAVRELLFKSEFGGDPHDEELLVRFSGFWCEDRYNHLEGTLPSEVWGGREVLVVSNPTAAAPTLVMSRLLLDVVREDGRYKARLEGTPIIEGTLAITNSETGATITDGLGLLGGDGDGTIDYNTGWIEFAWDVPPDAWPDKILHTYSHGNLVPGFKGDIAILKGDPTQRWICTVASATDATWAAL